MKPVNSELVWLAGAVDFEGSILMYPNWTPKKVPTSIRAKYYYTYKHRPRFNTKSTQTS